MQKVRLGAALVVLAAIDAVLLSLLIPTPTDQEWASFHPYLARTLAMTVLFVGSSLLLINGLRDFTPKLKRSYIFLCLGFSLMGLTFVQIPVATTLVGPAEILFRGSPFIAIPLLIALFAIITGTRSFARLFGINNLTTKWWFIIVPPIFLGLAYAQLPHVPLQMISELQFDITKGFNVFSTWVAIVACIHVLQVKKHASAQYTNALAWLVITFGFLITAGAGHLATVLWISEEFIQVNSLIIFVPLLFAGLAFLRSAYAFNKISRETPAERTNTSARNFFGKPLQKQTQNTSNSIDIVIYAASLVSVQDNLNPMLRPLRDITSKLKPGEAPDLGVDDQKQLEEMYLKIEDYLLTKEAARAFTKESLRKTIAEDLKLTKNKATFWDNLPL